MQLRSPEVSHDPDPRSTIYNIWTNSTPNFEEPGAREASLDIEGR